MCLYYSPLIRIANMLIADQRKNGGTCIPTVGQVMEICLKAWDYKNSDFVFENYVPNHGTMEQEVYIRANPASVVKHSISPTGDDLKKGQTSGNYKAKWAPAAPAWVQGGSDRNKPSPNSGPLPSTPWWENKDPWAETKDPWDGYDKAGKSAAWKFWDKDKKL
jgi:hypothetical protein